MAVIKPFYSKETILAKYEEFRKLLGTYSSFNRFYGDASMCYNNLEIRGDISWYDDNEIKIKVAYENALLFEVGLKQNPDTEWYYIDSMWVWCNDASFGNYYEINLHDLALYKEVKFTDNNERDAWFDNLLIRELVGTEEFFYVWQDYKCTCPQGFSDVVTDIWYHGVSEEFKDEFYAKYKDVFTPKKQTK